MYNTLLILISTWRFVKYAALAIINIFEMAQTKPKNRVE